MVNFQHNGKQRVFFTSDLHLNHQQDFVWKSRGYNSFEDHRNKVIESINNDVGINDVLFCLGDGWLNTTIDAFHNDIDAIKCQNIYMLWGNHPNPHYKNVYIPLVKSILGSNYINGMELYPIRYKNIIYIGNYAEITVNGICVILSHYPHYVWNYMQKGAFHLTGHSHYGCPLSKLDSPHGRILDVGWDGHGKVWAWDELYDVLSKKEIVAMDHHKPEVNK